MWSVDDVARPRRSCHSFSTCMCQDFSMEISGTRFYFQDPVPYPPQQQQQQLKRDLPVDDVEDIWTMERDSETATAFDDHYGNFVDRTGIVPLEEPCGLGTENCRAYGEIPTSTLIRQRPIRKPYENTSNETNFVFSRSCLNRSDSEMAVSFLQHGIGLWNHTHTWCSTFA